MLRVGVISLGAPHHAKIFINNMNAILKHYSFEFLEPSKEYGWAHIDPRELDVLWFHGFHALPDLLISKFKEENPNLKVIVLWVGSDVLEFVAFATHRPQCKNCIIKGIDLHVADGHNLIGELDSLGIKASYIPSIPEKPLELKPLSEKFSVAAYVPGFRADFFNFGMIKQVAEKIRDVEFHLFGGGPVKLEPNGYPDYLTNMTYHGWVEGEEKRKWWEQTSVFIYIPRHGSLGVGAIEFLQMGRYVITSMDAPYCIKVNSSEELLEALKKLKNIRDMNIEASNYYLERYSPKGQANAVEKVLDSLSNKK